MFHLTRRTGLPLFAVIVIALCGVELWVVSSPAFPSAASPLALVITLDLLLGIPLLFYGLVMRPYRLSPIAVAPIFLLAVVLAGYILPPDGRRYLDAAAMLLPLLELALLAAFLWKARALYRRYRHARNKHMYFTEALETSVQATFGANLAFKLITLELTLMFLAFFGWFMTFRTADPQAKVFSYHRKSLYTVVFLVFLVLMIVETVGFHLLIQHWSPLLAWILTGSSIYTIFWLIGDFNATRLHPIVLANATLHLRSGLRWSAALPLADIVEVQKPKQRDAKSPGYLSLARAGQPQLVLLLRRPARVEGLFGRVKQVSRIGLFLDEVGAFREELARQRAALGAEDVRNVEKS
jgi:hypothetical protein